MELNAQKTFNKASNTLLHQISCSNVPDELFDRVAAKVYFQQFGRVIRMVLRPKSKTCIIEYDSAESAEKALQNGGSYKDAKFFVGCAEKKPKIRKKRPSKTEEELDPTWPIDSEVQKELDAMKNAFTTTRKYILRPEGMQVDSPSEPVKVIKKTLPKKVLKKSPVKSKTPEFKPINKTETKKIAKPVSVIDTTAVADLLSVIKQAAHTSDERFRVLDARDKLIRMHTIKQVDIAKAAKTVGTCPDMCPEKERLMRESKHQVALYEQTTNSRGEHCMNHRTAIKQYSRSSADQNVPLPHELRPVDVLHLSMNYILLKLVDLCDTSDVNLAEWYHFIWDRTRGIRKDITQQELCCKRSVELVERCARFHIHCSARLVAEDISVFDQKINTENLTKCLQTLKYMYHDLELEGEECPNEAEFRAYIVLLNLNDSNFMWEVKNLRNEIQKSPEVRFAIRVFFALDNNNYVSFFKLVRSATYLNACILLRYFNQLRYRALERIVWTHSPRTTAASLSAEELKNILAFEDVESTVAFLKYHGLHLDSTLVTQVVLDRRSLVDPTLPYASQRAVNVIESKRNSSVGEIIYGSKLPSIDFDAHVPQNSFDENGFLKKSETDESWNSHSIKVQPTPRTEPEMQDKPVKPLFARNDDWDSPPPADKVDSTVKTTVQGAQNIFSTRGPFENKQSNAGEAMQRNSPILKQEKNLFVKKTDSSSFQMRFTAFVSSGQPFASEKPPTTVSSMFRPITPFKFDPKQTKSEETKEPTSDDQVPKVQNGDKKPQAANIFRIPSKMDVYTFSEPDSNLVRTPKLFSHPVPPKENIFEVKEPGTTGTSFTELFSKPIMQPKLQNSGFVFNLEKTKTDSERLEEEAERKKRETMEKEMEETRKRLEEEAERKRKQKEEEERRKEEERKNEERKRIEAEQKRLEEIRREAETRARLRQIEIQRQRAEQERRQEIERIICVKSLIDELVEKTERAERARKLDEIKRNLEKIALKEVIGKWRRKVASMKRKRKAVDDLPTWVSKRSIVTEASELCSDARQVVLGDMKQYKLGIPVRLVLPDLPKAKRVDLETLVRNDLRSRLNNRSRMVNNLFWNVKISLPDRRESYEESDRLREIVDTAFGITDTDRPTVVSRMETYGTFNVAVEKKIGTFGGTLDEKVDVLFVGIDNSDSVYSLRNRLTSVLKRKSELDPIPIVIVLRRGRDPTGIDSIEDLLELNTLRNKGIISTFKFFYDERGTDENLSVQIEEGLKQLARCTTYPPSLEIDYFHSILCNCIGTELNDRLKCCTKTNKKFEQILSMPQIVIGVHNEAISKLCEIVTEDISGYPRFPAVFDGCLDERAVFPRGYEHISNYHLSRRYRDDVVVAIKTLTLPEFVEWPPRNIESLQGSLNGFCKRSIRDTSSNVFLRVWASVLHHLENSDGTTFVDKLDGFPWLDIVQTILSEKLNNIDYNIDTSAENRLNFKTVVYDRNAMTRFRNDYWWYEMDVVREFIQSAEEPDERFDVETDEEDSKIEYDLDKSLAEATAAVANDHGSSSAIDYVGFKRMLNDLETSMSIQRKAQQKFDDILEREIASFGK